jgi:2-polyprenyl-3-methyl-5-hydroxy-6-metoxy-1,4-benzoquinol methylase
MLPDLSHRSTGPEIMDSAAIPFPQFDRALGQIEAVNALTLGYRPILRWLGRQDLSGLRGKAVTILDVGCGRGALLRSIYGWARRRSLDVRLSGIDIHPWAKDAAERATPAHMQIEYQCGDILVCDPEPAELVVCSHVTHHLTDEAVVKFLRRLDGLARRGWFVSDLHRHPASYLLAKSLLCVAPVDRMLRSDGPTSVLRAFTARDWREYLHRAGIPTVRHRIEWFFPFRYGIAGWKD